MRRGEKRKRLKRLNRDIESKEINKMQNRNGTQLMTGEEIISRYTRREAIEDGYLVDLMTGDIGDMVREAGIKFPVAMTAEAYGQTVCKIGSNEPLPYGQDLKGRLWDVLYTLYHAIRRSDLSTNTVTWTVRVLQRNNVPWQSNETRRQRIAGVGQHRDVTLKAIVGPGDNGEPVITIMQPDQD